MSTNSGMDGQARDGDRRDVTSAARTLGFLTLLSRVSGLARDVVVSAMFGASAGADAFFVAFRIPNLFRRVVGEGATSAAFVPVFTDALVSGGKDRALRAAAAVGGVALTALALLSALGMLAAGPVVALFAPGFTDDPAKAALTVELTRYCFPYLFLVGAAAWAMGLLHTFRSFAVPAYGPILLNLAIIAAAVTLVGWIEPAPAALVVGVLVGGSLQFLVQVPSLWRMGLRPADLLLIRDPAVRRVGRLMGAAVVGGAVYQINVLVATVFASLLPDRSVSWLWYADRVFEFPLGIVAVAVGTAVLPTLAAQARSGRLEDMVSGLDHALALTWLLCVPSAVALWQLAPDIVTVLLQRGRFDALDTEMTAWALRAYVPGLLGVASVRVLSSAFYALEKPRIPVRTAILALFINATCDLALMGPTDPNAGWWGAHWVAAAGDALRVADLRHAGLALATGLAASVNAVVLLVLLGRELPRLPLRPLLMGMARPAAAAAVMALVIEGLGGVLAAAPGGVWLRLPLQVLAGAGVYVGVVRMLGSREINELLSLAQRRR